MLNKILKRNGPPSPCLNQQDPMGSVSSPRREVEKKETRVITTEEKALLDAFKSSGDRTIAHELIDLIMKNNNESPVDAISLQQTGTSRKI